MQYTIRHFTCLERDRENADSPRLRMRKSFAIFALPVLRNAFDVGRCVLILLRLSPPIRRQYSTGRTTSVSKVADSTPSSSVC